jgi:DNA-binding response OmpR family regulator
MKPQPLPLPAQAPDFTISIVEDEPVLRHEMAFQLRHFNFAVQAFDSAAAFYRYLAVQPRTIALLDIGLAGEDGLSICRHLREHDAQMGIVFLTAHGLRDDRLTGLAAGADAYLVKPVDMEELVLILRRLSLRFSPQLPAAPAHRESPEAGGWIMEPGSGFVTAPNGLNVHLSVSEGQLLRALVGKAGAACNHAQMATALDLLPDEINKHRIEVIISRLRNKVERITGLSLPLKAVRGVGYRMSLETR